MVSPKENGNDGLTLSQLTLVKDVVNNDMIQWNQDIQSIKNRLILHATAIQVGVGCKSKRVNMNTCVD